MASNDVAVHFALPSVNTLLVQILLHLPCLLLGHLSYHALMGPRLASGVTLNQSSN